MGWRMPPPDVRRRVNAAFGTDMYQRLSEVWDASLAELPSPVPAYTRTQQYRGGAPETITGAEGPISPESGHYLGLAFDVGWSQWSPETKAELARVLSATRIRTTTGQIIPIVVEAQGGGVWKPGAALPANHLHWGVGRSTIKRLGMIPYIQEIVAGLRGQIAGR